MTPDQFDFVRLAAGPDGHQSPMTSNRASVRMLVAWHRTANDCQSRGWVDVSCDGSRYTARATPAGKRAAGLAR
jgi:hypothetical protein